MPVRLLYGVIPSRRNASSTSTHLRRASRMSILNQSLTERYIGYVKKPTDMQSAARSSIAFMCSVAFDIISAVTNPSKMKRWIEALSQFRAYLKISGIDAELGEGVTKPLMRGRLFCNLKILNDIQEVDIADRYDRVKECGQEDIEQEITDGTRIMRFATAAYGIDMIRSALDRSAACEVLQCEKKAIAFHTGIAEKDVKLIHVGEGGSMKVLRHFVAIDRESKSIIIALRGTLSISGALIDMQGMSCDFCHGKAHKGMAEMADNLWNVSSEKILKLFEREEFKDYGFTITGHSLGAGVASLLNIKCHVEELVGTRSVKCFVFAPPPVFCLHEDEERSQNITSSIQKAIADCVCYIHDNDCIPFLSVTFIRRLAYVLDAVDNKTQLMWPLQRFKIFWELQDIPQDIIESVKKTRKENLQRSLVEGESPLVAPARIVVWMIKNVDDNTFTGIGCKPETLRDLNIFVNQDMVTDHLPEQYENALDFLCN
mmetsp:Transcript_400/g.520  ORF Transcript_400/g.520 Transcript_400/m.520 type:complete len:487 (+) Transcript_400:327-1787(+)